MKNLGCVLLIIFVSLSCVCGQAANATGADLSALQKLPQPTGSYKVGTSMFHLVDNSRPDAISKKPNQFREIMLQVWYPAEASSKDKPAPYIPSSELLQSMKNGRYSDQNSAVIENFANVQTAAAIDATLSKKQSKFPLLLFSHGLGMSRSNYTALTQDLASFGYIVVSIDHPYGGYTILPDGRILTTTREDSRGATEEGSAALTGEWVQDASFILDRFNSPEKSYPEIMKQISRHIDFKKIGMLGHSIGGSAALDACRIDPRFKACANLDGQAFGKSGKEGVKTPTLVMLSQPVYSDEDLAKKGRTREQWTKMGQERKVTFSALLPKNKEIPIYFIKVAGTGHMSFSDAQFTMPDIITRFGGQIIDASVGFQIISGYIRDFFGKYLKGEKSTLLDAAAPPYPQISYLYEK